MLVHVGGSWAWIMKTMKIVKNGARRNQESECMQVPHAQLRMLPAKTKDILLLKRVHIADQIIRSREGRWRMEEDAENVIAGCHIYA
jgi:hypothetical protein